MSTVYQERGRFRPDVLSFVSQELRRGVSDNSYGYHGTSIYTLLHMLRFGVIPGKSTPDRPEFYRHPKRGDVYFWKRGNGDDSRRDAIDGAKQYAKMIARKHHVIETLKLSYYNPSHSYAALELANRLCDEKERLSLVRELGNQGLSEAKIMNAVTDAQNLKGVLIGFSPLLETSYAVIDCNNPDDGWKVETKTGLPYHFVEGIQFLSLNDEQHFRQHLTQ